MAQLGFPASRFDRITSLLRRPSQACRRPSAWSP